MNYRLFIFAALFLFQNTFSQVKPANDTSSVNSKDTSTVTAKDTVSLNFYYEKIRDKNKSYAENDIIAVQQSRIISELRTRIDFGKKTLKQQVFDSTKINSSLQKIMELNDKTSEGVFINEDKFLMLSNLSNSSVIFTELADRVEKISADLKKQRIELEQIQLSVDSLASVEILFKELSDTTGRYNYITKLTLLEAEALILINGIKVRLLKIQELEVTANMLKFDLEMKISQTDLLQRNLYYSQGIEEFEGFLKYSGSGKSFNEILKYSYDKISLVLDFYSSNHRAFLIIILLFTFGLAYYVKMLKKHMKNITDKNELTTNYILRFPLITSLILTLNIFQFFFVNPPFLIYGGIWLVTFIMFIFITKYEFNGIWRILLIVFSIFYSLAYIDNLILLPHWIDKLFVLLLALSGLLWGIIGIVKLKNSDDKLNFMKWFLFLFGVIELISIVYNLMNHFNMSKRLMVAGYISTIFIFLSYYSLNIIHKVILFSMEVYKKEEGVQFVINHNNFKKKIPKALYLIAVAGWLYMMVRFFYVLQELSKPLVDFITKDITMGNTSFSVGDILIFMVVIVISTLLAKLVSHFLSDSYIVKSYFKEKNKSGIGSWVLLLRIGIISIGILIAFTVIGIPLDQITIIISALSVGIGIGMQTLVNNLVSGLIIAFEKPINVGDIVEISGKIGRMKSIGVRSSMITSFDGADVVIPNGDLLSQHLTNWTFSDFKARKDIKVGIAYGTDLAKAEKLLTNLLSSKENVLKYPEPIIAFTNFGDSSIDISIMFWISNFMNGLTIKSEIIIAIDKMFKENGIEIPFPQQDVYIKSQPDRRNEKSDEPAIP